MVSLKPHAVTPMHHVSSYDFNMIVEGEVELILDLGERRMLKVGDTNIQRWTMHMWINRTPNNGWRACSPSAMISRHRRFRGRSRRRIGMAKS